MSRRLFTRCATILLVATLGTALPMAAAPQPDEELAKSRDAIARILRDESEVLAELERVEGALREAEASAAEAADAHQAAEEELVEAEAERQQAEAILRGQEERLGTRLRARYRLLRVGGPQAAIALTGGSPAALGRQRRALDRILEADLELVQAARDSARRLSELEREREARLRGLGARKVEAEAALAQAKEAASDHQRLLAALRSERALHERRIRELHRAQEQLDQELGDLARGSDRGPRGFAALEGELPWPVEGAVVEVLFGKMLNARFNTVVAQNGLDLRAPKGADVVAVAPGKVIYADWFRAYGNLLILDHGGGYHTLYGHLESFAARVGSTVEAEDLVGSVGDSGSLKGPYLYFELRKDGKPIDPLRWFGAR